MNDAEQYATFQSIDPIIRFRPLKLNRAKQKRSCHRVGPFVEDVIGLSRATVYRYIDEGDFPKPVKLGVNSIGWRLSVLQAWLVEKEIA